MSLNSVIKTSFNDQHDEDYELSDAGSDDRLLDFIEEINEDCGD